MHYALNVPNFGETADPAVFLRFAREAEASGWDGIFVWDHILGARDWAVPMADPWLLLAAAATVTERITLGPMVTPLPRRRPWLVARSAVTLDQLSDGRLLLGVGLGTPAEAEFGAFGEETDARVRAEKLDEGLAIITGLWSGESFAFSGRQYRLEPMVFQPRPVQQPRIPIVVAATWPHRQPLRRAARWDGIFPQSTAVEDGQPIPIDDLRACIAEVRAARGDDAAPFEVVVAGPAATAPGLVAQYAAAGATWWCTYVSGWDGWVEDQSRIIRAGPPTQAT